MRFASIILSVGLLGLASGARADVIVLKNGVRLEAERVFDLAGAYWYYRDGERFSISSGEVEKIEKALPTRAAQATSPAPQLKPQAATCEESTPDEDEQAREDFLYIRQCRYQMNDQAKKNDSDFKASCSRALRMIEKMYEGRMPNDGAFGYHLEFLSNPLMWEILPPDNSAKLRGVVFQEGGPLDEFIGPWKERMRQLKVKETFVLANAAEAHEDVVRQQEIAYRATHNAQTRWQAEVERRLAAASSCVGDGDSSGVNFEGSHASTGVRGMSGNKLGSKSVHKASSKKNSKKSSGSSNKSSGNSSSSSSGGSGGHHRSGGT